MKRKARESNLRFKKHFFDQDQENSNIDLNSNYKNYLSSQPFNYKSEKQKEKNEKDIIYSFRNIQCKFIKIETLYKCFKKVLYTFQIKRENQVQSTS